MYHAVSPNGRQAQVKQPSAVLNTVAVCSDKELKPGILAQNVVHRRISRSPPPQRSRAALGNRAESSVLSADRQHGNQEGGTKAVAGVVAESASGRPALLHTVVYNVKKTDKAGFQWQR